MFVIWSHEKGLIMSHQLTFADSEFSSKRRQTRKEILEGANKRGNSSRLTQSFHFFMFEPIF
ncbi:hypothetical protein, partial [Aeromonas enteropelogenes]|uniref:hypothetical protein n=1 Tax=Aeromonas enteropelogenes TaxID=29489 RepID=UPI003BA0799C